MADQKKSRKHGRNKTECEVYRARGRREQNKAKKMLRHAARHPNDTGVISAIKHLRHNGGERAWRDAVRSYLSAHEGSRKAHHLIDGIDKFAA